MSLVDTVKQYAAALKNDFEGSLNFLADDVVWINLLPKHVPFGGEYVGKQEVVRFFMLMAETFELGDYAWDDFDYIESANALVIVGCEANGMVIPTGKVFDLNFVWVVKFNDDGKICYLREHNDTAAIGDAFKP
jgi:ketosteroid isomerase-like protein